MRREPQPFYDPRPPNDLLAALGKVSNELSLLEYYVNQTIWALLHVKPTLGACITAQIIPIAGRMDALETLAVARGISDKLVNEIRSFAGKAKGLGQERNRVLHDTWAVEKPRIRTVRLEVSAKKNPVYGFKLEKTGDVLKLADKIRQSRFTYNLIHDKILDELKTLPRTRVSPFRPRLLESSEPLAERGKAGK
jgi:hypothetical protein